MGVEQNSDLRVQLIVAHNKAAEAQTSHFGSAMHQAALLRFARVIADHPEGLSIAKELSQIKS